MPAGIDAKEEYKMKKLLLFTGLALLAFVAKAEIQIIDGVKYECVDGMCRMIEEDESAASTEEADATITGATTEVRRMCQGYQSVEEIVSFLKDEQAPSVVHGINDFTALAILIILLGGLMMNLTPCVLPMIPISLMVIGKSAVRGLWYGLGIALAYGALGVLAAIGGMAFGTIQGNPWFNAVIAVIFIILALALSGVFFIDLSKKRGGLAQKKSTMLPWLFAFFMGIMSAILAGACVAPILISVLLLTAKLYAEGNMLALGLPFVLGIGMALPWPFLGAGMQVLPKPGTWMKWVNNIFAIIVLGFAAWYGYLAYRGFTENSGAQNQVAQEDGVLVATPENFGEVLKSAKRPVFVDCWATWCKNCSAMESKVFTDSAVKEALKPFTVIKMQAENMKELKALEGFHDIQGLPAFVIFE